MLIKVSIAGTAIVFMGGKKVTQLSHAALAAISSVQKGPFDQELDAKTLSTRSQSSQAQSIISEINPSTPTRPTLRWPQ